MAKFLSITIFIPTFDGGGAERAAINSAAMFAFYGHKVTLLSQRHIGSLAVSLPNFVEVKTLAVARTLAALLPLTHYLRRNKPDLLIAHLPHGNIISLLAKILAFSKTQVLLTQHSMLSSEIKSHQTFSYKFLPFLYFVVHRFAAAIIAVSQKVEADLAMTAGIPARRITRIYNPVLTPHFEAQLLNVYRHPWFKDKGMPVILGVGRLVAEKDLSTLLKAFALARTKKPMRLMILGEGPMRSILQQFATDLGVEKDFMLAGFQPNPLPFLHDAAVVVVSSLYEGLCHVLVEALATGTKTISTDCPGGPAEILKNGQYGRLVPVGDAEAMAQSILDTLEEPNNAEFLKQRAQDFTFDRVYSEYQKLFVALKLLPQ